MNALCLLGSLNRATLSRRPRQYSGVLLVNERPPTPLELLKGEALARKNLSFATS